METREITLPASGKVARIREGDGHADRILFENRAGLHEALPSYLAYLVTELDGNPVERDDILGLLVPDRRFLQIECSRLNYGDELKLRDACMSCGEVHDWEVNLAELDVIALPDGVAPGDPTREVTLKRSGHRVTFGFLTARDAMHNDGAEKFDPIRIAHQAIRSMDGAERPSYEKVKALPLADHAQLREAMANFSVGYDTSVTFTCPNAGKKVTKDIAQDSGFLLRGFPV